MAKEFDVAPAGLRFVLATEQGTLYYEEGPHRGLCCIDAISSKKVEGYHSTQDAYTKLEKVRRAPSDRYVGELFVAEVIYDGRGFKWRKQKPDEHTPGAAPADPVALKAPQPGRYKVRGDMPTLTDPLVAGTVPWAISQARLGALMGGVTSSVEHAAAWEPPEWIVDAILGAYRCGHMDATANGKDK